MINDIFYNVDTGIGRSLYADDGAVWKRGRNVLFVENKMQKAVNEVENWANIWGFRFSVAKTQVICFSKKKNNISLNVKMYGYQLEQVNVVRFLGMWMDSKLHFRIHIQKLIEKCKNRNKWEDFLSLKTINGWMQLNVAATILSFRREDLSVNYFLGSQGPRKCIELHLSIFM